MNHLGLTLAQLGPFADPTSVETMAVAAESPRLRRPVGHRPPPRPDGTPAPSTRRRPTAHCPTSSASPSTR